VVRLLLCLSRLSPIKGKCGVKNMDGTSGKLPQRKNNPEDTRNGLSSDPRDWCVCCHPPDSHNYAGCMLCACDRYVTFMDCILPPPHVPPEDESCG
jgi:hypothetical protein